MFDYDNHIIIILSKGIINLIMLSKEIFVAVCDATKSESPAQKNICGGKLLAIHYTKHYLIRNR